MKRIPNTLYMDGYDDCLVGHIERFGQPLIACYDKARVLHKLEQDGMTADEAIEFFYFNQIGAWVGEYSPCFLDVEDNQDETDS